LRLQQHETSIVLPEWPIIEPRYDTFEKPIFEMEKKQQLLSTTERLTPSRPTKEWRIKGRKITDCLAYRGLANRSPRCQHRLM
jgi:hypothetical protein